MNNHLSSCSLGGSSDNLTAMYFVAWEVKKKGSYFQMLTFMKLAEKHNLLLYEKLLQSRSYVTLNLR